MLFYQFQFFFQLDDMLLHRWNFLCFFPLLKMPKKPVFVWSVVYLNRKWVCENGCLLFSLRNSNRFIIDFILFILNILCFFLLHLGNSVRYFLSLSVSWYQIQEKFPTFSLFTSEFNLFLVPEIRQVVLQTLDLLLQVISGVLNVNRFSFLVIEPYHILCFLEPHLLLCSWIWWSFRKLLLKFVTCHYTLELRRQFLFWIIGQPFDAMVSNAVVT